MNKSCWKPFVEAADWLVYNLLAIVQDQGTREFYEYPQAMLGLKSTPPVEAKTISIGTSPSSSVRDQLGYFIINSGQVPRNVELKRNIRIGGLITGGQASVLASAGSSPLLLAGTYGEGRVVLFNSYEWVKPDVKGKVYGLDDLVWRSLVWAARKPFVLRAMPHFLAFRVDDVSGFGIGSNRHLGWVAEANQYGLKPWLGIFIDDLKEDPEAIRALAQYTNNGLATASPHARRWHEFFYLEEPLWTDEYGRNVGGRPWPDSQMSSNFAEAMAFFQEHQIPRSKVILPHFYQFALNNFEGLRNWGAEFTGTVLQPGYGYGTLVPPAGPYLSGESLRASNAMDPIFIADWLRVPGHPEFDRQLFNLVVEIRDVTGYEWAPSGVPVEEAIRRGVVETRREWDSLLPGVLFTHESDHIQHIPPDDWRNILQGVMDGLRDYQPTPITLDELCQYMRALKTSRISMVGYDPESREGWTELEGASDMTTKFYVYENSGSEPMARELSAPPFEGKVLVKW